MAMHHADTVIARVVQKLVADPAHVRGVLFIEWRSRADARVDKQIVARSVEITETAQERDVLGGDMRR